MSFTTAINRLIAVARQSSFTPGKVIFNESNRAAVKKELGTDKSYLGVKIVFVNECGEET
jgi:hypothetical protein